MQSFQYISDNQWCLLNIINNVKKFKSLNTSFRDLSHTVHALTFRKLVV